MRNSQSITPRIDVRVGLRVDPKVVLSSRILELPQFELEQAVQQEIIDNPALEMVEEQFDQISEEELTRTITRTAETKSREDDFDAYVPKLLEPDDAANWTEFIAAPTTLEDHLLAQLLPAVEPQLQPLARYMIECVAPSGYLEMPIEEIAHTSGFSLKQAKKVLAKLQECDPSGVGAHNLKECLLLQLADPQDDIEKLARLIVAKYWDAVPTKRAQGIARKVGVPETMVAEAFARIARLAPYPGDAFSTGTPAASRSKTAAAAPDVVFWRDENGIKIEIRGCDASFLSLNSWYRERYRAIKQGTIRAGGEEVKHIQEYVGRALMFIRGLQQRKQTLRKIAIHLLDEELAFIATGSYKFLRGETRVQAARAVNLHESTISRATMGKFVQIANGDIVPFDVFFKPAIRVQKMIEEILQNENPNRPLSDREIAEQLKSRGVKVARRTVNKYREQCRTLSSHQRRSA